MESILSGPHPSPKNCSTRSNPQSVALEDIFTSKVTPRPVPLFSVTKPQWRTPQNGFNALLPRLPNSMRIGLSAQTVNDLLSMYVGAASQHVLRMSFVPEHEARTFDTEVTAFWSQLIKRDATSRLFYLPLQMGGLRVGSAVQRHAAGPWPAWQSVLPTLMAATQSPDTDTLFTLTPRLRAQLVRQTALSQQMNTPAFLLKPLGPAVPHQHHPEEACHLRPKAPPQTTP